MYIEHIRATALVNIEVHFFIGLMCRRNERDLPRIFFSKKIRFYKAVQKKFYENLVIDIVYYVYIDIYSIYTHIYSLYQIKQSLWLSYVSIGFFFFKKYHINAEVT